MMEAGAKRAKPMRSKRGRILRRKATVTGGLGVWSRMVMKARKMPATAPRGRLIQKPGTVSGQCQSAKAERRGVMGNEE
jgi:hypothetical protein